MFGTTGNRPQPVVPCPQCKGSGKISYEVRVFMHNAWGMSWRYEPCNLCKGSGQHEGMLLEEPAWYKSLAASWAEEEGHNVS